MGAETFLEEAKKIVAKIVPPNVKITNIEIEGPIVVIYTKSFEEFASNNDIVRQLAQGLRRRVAIRPDPSLLAEIDIAETEIRHIIPPEAEITDIYFEEDSGEVTIEAITPGLAIGKHGAILNEIKKRIGWAPKVVRSPPIPSKTVSDIRNYLKTVSEERKDWLKKIGKRIAREPSKGETWVRITALGGYREVGRSATLLSTNNSKVLIDCGIDVGSEGNGSPYLNAPELQPLDALDAVVVTHAHLDHSGLVPVLYKYGYDGPIYCSAPTRDVMSLLQLDYIKVAYGEGKKAPYESSHIREAVKHCIPLRFGDTTDIAPDIRLTLQNAGHILGSSVLHFHIGDGAYNIAILGDMKYEKTWLFNPTVDKFPRVETLVLESTYGGYHDIQPSRKEAGEQLKDIVTRTFAKGGKVLIPVFAIGRSQEVMIVLEQLMRTGEIPEAPVYLDGMIWEATSIHTAYPEYLNSSLRNQIFQLGENPFLSKIFQRVDHAEKREKIVLDPEQKCVVLATSGMMNGGPVMEYFKHWAEDKRNTLVFVGYQAEGTMGRRIQKGWTEIPITEHGKTITINVQMNVETCDGFSGHSDRKQLMSYVQNLQPKPERVIVFHGEESKCLELASGIYKKFGIETRAPMNLETIRLK